MFNVKKIILLLWSLSLVVSAIASAQDLEWEVRFRDPEYSSHEEFPEGTAIIRNALILESWGKSLTGHVHYPWQVEDDGAITGAAIGRYEIEGDRFTLTIVNGRYKGVHSERTDITDYAQQQFDSSRQDPGHLIRLPIYLLGIPAANGAPPPEDLPGNEPPVEEPPADQPPEGNDSGGGPGGEEPPEDSGSDGGDVNPDEGDDNIPEQVDHGPGTKRFCDSKPNHPHCRENKDEDAKNGKIWCPWNDCGGLAESLGQIIVYDPADFLDLLVIEASTETSIDLEAAGELLRSALFVPVEDLDADATSLIIFDLFQPPSTP